MKRREVLACHIKHLDREVEDGGEPRYVQELRDEVPGSTPHFDHAPARLQPRERNGIQCVEAPCAALGKCLGRSSELLLDGVAVVSGPQGQTTAPTGKVEEMMPPPSNSLGSAV